MKNSQVVILVAVTIACNEAVADVTNGLVAHWSFDDCTATDVIGGHASAIVGAPQCVDGVNGKALLFNGISDYVEVANRKDLNTSAITISAWILPTYSNQSNNGWMIVNKENQYEIQIMNEDSDSAQAGNLAFSLNASWYWYDANTKPSPTKFTHVAITFDKNYHGKAYVNGKLTNDISYGAPLSSIKSCLRIGARNCIAGSLGPDSFFEGVIDDVRIYSRALSEVDIKNLYYGIVPSMVQGSANWAQFPYKVVCTNNTSGARVTMNSKASPQYNCENSGLVVQSGDSISVTITGVTR